MKKISTLILSLILITHFSQAQAKRDKEPNIQSLIGKRIFQAPLIDWLEKNDYKLCEEELQATENDGTDIIFKNYKKGYLMRFDLNMVLFAITLYGPAGVYVPFDGKLPLNLKFGMNRDSLYKEIDLRLEEVEDNPYLLTRTINHQKIELFFNSKGLTQVGLLANDTLPKADDLGFVRLVSSGTIVNGNCDSSKGKMAWDKGTAYYDGEWKNSMPHGKGIFKDQYDNVYKGDFKYGFFWGKGQLTVTNFYQYSGDFVMSRRHGQGNCQFKAPKGESYEGQWRQDAMNGLGKYLTSPKHYYYGNMLNGKFNGQGKLVTPEGWMEGIFKNGMPNGLIKQYLKLDNTLIEGQWVNGKREGKFTLTNTETKKITYKNFLGDIEISIK